MSQFRAIVHGRAQGVCFRAETIEQARRLGLRGHARNLSDGTVEIVAEGNETALRRLLEFLHVGPDMARVDKVEVDWDDRSPVGPGFHLGH